MENLECPSCRQMTVPLWRKMCLGPATGTACSNCGSRVSVPWSAMLSAIPFMIALLAAQLVGSFALGEVVLIVGAVGMFWIHYKFVPLIVK